ncbi:MAG: hypothetical protein KJ646_02595 [Nanoarchaeota archaeon]|nr:hypothetical protein [Nanoarchaeota archaeon]MBU4116452.1 hypothetical protein [Nanoarchaeota archaeon]
MRELIKNISNKIENYPPNQIEFTQYCFGRMKERNIKKNIVITTLFSKNNLYYVEEQLKQHQGEIEKRYKLIFKISSKYSLILIIAFYPKVLKVVNVIKTSKGTEKKWRKTILK